MSLVKISDRFRFLMTIPVYIIAIIFLSGCCGEIRSGYQEIDVTPLFEAKINIPSYILSISGVIDLNIFDQVTEDGPTVIGSWFGETGKMPRLGKSWVDVMLTLSANEKMAQDDFRSSCGALEFNPSDFIYGGDGNNKYCISYVREIRDTPEYLCRPTGVFDSYVVFLKGRLTIQIIEHAKIVDSTAKNDVILLLAQKLNE